MSTELLTQTQQNLVLAVNKASEIACMPNDITKSLAMAGAINELRNLLNVPEVTKVLEDMQNTKLGFLTDRKDNGYPKNVLVDCALQALSMGLNIHGNEFNVIAGHCYPAQAGFDRLLREYCQKNRIKRQIQNEIPRFIEDKGKQSVFEVKFTIIYERPTEDKVVSIQKWHVVGTSIDQALGKGLKRAYQWLYNELSNNSLPLDSEDDFDIDGGEFTASKSEPVSEVVVGLIRDGLETKKMNEADYCKKAGIDKLEDINPDKANQLLAWFEDNK